MTGPQQHAQQTVEAQPMPPQVGSPVPAAEEHGPAPLGTLLVVGVLLLVTLAFWMLVLGIQQARA